MKSLALYIDKWYIVGVIDTDGIPRPVKLPNHEERIWLYFYEDMANDEVSYGKGFQRKYSNKVNHYYGDVFTLITQSAAHFTQYKLSQPIRSIFKAANIFTDLKKNVEAKDNIPTYVSFSKDISPLARHIFLEELTNNGFDVKESAARIGHLALEYAAKRADFTTDGFYLVINACNENMHYSLYRKTANLFNREKEDMLQGMGTDIRSRALIEYVVDNINEREHFLKSKDEREAECLRMNLYVLDWLTRLSSARDFVPIQLTGITLSNDPYKDYSVSVRKAKIDERTQKIVSDIISVIARFVKGANVSHEQLCGVLLLGDSFTNAQFKKELASYYNLDSSKMICYKDADLPSIVNAYSFIDCKQFSTDQEAIGVEAEAERRRIQIAEEEAASAKKAREEADAKYKTEREAAEKERRFKDAMDKGYEAEREHNYSDMEDFFRIALDHRPDSEEAKQKHDEALRKKAEVEVQQKHYKQKIQQARTAYEEADYELAKAKAVEALSFMPDSKEAQRITEEAQRHIKSQKELERYLDRADLFIANKAYSEARQELSKARLLDVDDKEIAEREQKIDQQEGNIKAQIATLSVKINAAAGSNQFDEAIKCCKELVEIDIANSRRWSVRLGELNAKKALYEGKLKQWSKLVRDIDQALLSEQWQRLAELCRNALDIRDDADIRSKLTKAEEKITESQRNELFTQTMSEINSLAVQKDFDTANDKLNALERMLRQDGLLDSHKATLIRETRKSIFDFGQTSTEPTITPEPQTPKGHTPIKGFSSEQDQVTKQKSIPRPRTNVDFDFDFGAPSHAKKSPTPKQTKPNAKSNGMVTNDDFNF